MTTLATPRAAGSNEDADERRAPRAANSTGSTKAKKKSARVQYANPAFGSTVPHDPDAKIVNFPCAPDALLSRQRDQVAQGPDGSGGGGPAQRRGLQDISRNEGDLSARA